MDPNDLDAAVRTVYGEAGGESPIGQQAVAGVIANRAKASGSSISDVVHSPGQFEPWNTRSDELNSLDPSSPAYQRIAQTISPVLTGQVPDPTGGATQFYSPSLQASLGRKPPAWDDGSGVDIGRHRFFGGRTNMADPNWPDYEQDPTTDPAVNPAAGGTYVPPELIRLRMQQAAAAGGANPGSGASSPLAGLFNGVRSGLGFGGAEGSLRNNQAMTDQAMRSMPVNVNDRTSLAKYLLSSGIPDLQQKGLDLILPQGRLQEAQAEQAENALTGARILQERLGMPSANPAQARVAISGSLAPGGPQTGALPQPPPATGQAQGGSPAPNTAAAGPPPQGGAPQGANQAPPEVQSAVQERAQRLQTAQTAAPRVAGVVNTANGPVAVDGSRQPLFNLSQLARDAKELGAIGAAYNMPQLSTLAEKQFEFISGQLKTGGQLNAQGGEMPIEGAAETAARQAGMVKGAEAHAENEEKRAQEYTTTSVAAHKLQGQTAYIQSLIDDADEITKGTGVSLFGPVSGQDAMIQLRAALPIEKYNKAAAVQQKLNMAFNQLAVEAGKENFPQRFTNADLTIMKQIKPNLMLENPGIARQLTSRLSDIAEGEKIRQEVYLKHGVDASEAPDFDPYQQARLGRKAGQPWNMNTVIPGIQSKYSIPDAAIQRLIEHPETAQQFDSVAGHSGAPQGAAATILAVARARAEAAAARAPKQ